MRSHELNTGGKIEQRVLGVAPPYARDSVNKRPRLLFFDDLNPVICLRELISQDKGTFSGLSEDKDLHWPEQPIATPPNKPRLTIDQLA